VIRIYTPDRNGFYAVGFGRAIKGTTTGWIAVGDVQVEGQPGQPAPPAGDSAAATPAKRRRDPNKVKSSWLDFSVDITLVSPSAFQSTILENSAGLTQIGFTAGYGHRFSGSIVGFQLDAFYASTSGTGTINGGTYTAKGFGADAGLDLQFVNGGQFSLSGVAKIGLSINSAGNTTSAESFSTSNIIGVPLRIELDARKYFGSFGILLGAGYQIETLSSVPVVLPLPGSPPPTSSANFSLSGLYGRLGVTLQFD
jgi:hypothetical protein